MASDVIYARVPTALKEAAEEYAAARNYTLTTAVSELLGLGLEAVHDSKSVEVLRRRIGELEHELGDSKAARDREELRRQVAEQQAAGLEHVAAAWNDRAQQQVGVCPHPSCNGEIRGIDLLVLGTCSTCKRGVNSMLLPETKTARVDWNELLPILVAGGVILGAVVAARGKA